MFQAAIHNDITYRDGDTEYDPTVLVSPLPALLTNELEIIRQLMIGSSVEYLVWSYKNAPETLQSISQNGGDEDWIVVALHDDGYTPWIERTDVSGEPDHYVTEKGMHIWIGSHA